MTVIDVEPTAIVTVDAVRYEFRGAARRKEDYPCCASKRDELGRLPVGDCGPDCLRRIERLAGR